MSEWGYKILNFQSASIYAVQHGFRKTYDFKKAMLTNSLFLDFLRQHGLSVVGETTRDVIGVCYDYGTRSYEEEVKHLNKLIMSCQEDEKKERLESIKQEVEENKDAFEKLNADEIRIDQYVNGLDITYTNHNKTTTKIHYKMLYRSPGKAKKGTCMFIREELYEAAREFLYMGIKLPDQNTPIVEIGAYSSLVTSTIVGHLQIDPEDVLILKDVDSTFKTNVVSIETNENRECMAIPKENYEVVNTLFDGQALIDLSIFPDYGNGYVLLRQHFTKCAAFATDIQRYYREHFGDEYETAKVVDMFGKEHFAKDIKLITTNNAVKWLKFNVSYEYWCEKVRENDCMWGVVKTAHESKLGDVQRMSYQMVNSLDEQTINNVVGDSLEYLQLLKTDTPTFIDYLRKNANFVNGYEVLVALWEHNHDFERSDYFRERRKYIIAGYLWNLKNGHVIANADNLVIVGNPYGMLMHSVGLNALDDPMFQQEDGAIQCWTDRFKYGEYLAEFRSPFNGRNNLGYLHNVYQPFLAKYFRFGNLIIAVNMIGTDWQARNNGADQDSDSCYTTNQPDIVAHAKYCYENYPTIVNNVPAAKSTYKNTLEDFAKVDNNIASRQLEIGASSNLAQIALTYTYNFSAQKYEDAVCILSVLAQIAIDSAKRQSQVDVTAENRRLRDDINIKDNGYPPFWSVIRKGFDYKKINHMLHSPMGYLCNLQNTKVRSKTATLPMSDFFVQHELDMSRKMSKKIEDWIEKYMNDVIAYNLSCSNQDEKADAEDNLLLRNDFELMIQDIRQLSISKKYAGLFSWLLNRAFVITPGIKGKIHVLDSDTSRNRSVLLTTLYTLNPQVFLSCFKPSLEHQSIEEDAQAQYS